MMEDEKTTPMDETNAELERFIVSIHVVGRHMEIQIQRASDTVLSSESGGQPAAAKATVELRNVPNPLGRSVS